MKKTATIENNLRILHIIDNDISGRYFHDLVVEQSKLYKEIGLLTFNESKKPSWLSLNNVVFFEHREFMFNRLLIGRFMYTFYICCRFNPDVVFTHLPKSASIGNFYCRIFGKSNIYVRHYLDEHWNMSFIKNRIWDYIINKSAKKILTMSRQTRDWLVNVERVRPSKVVVIPQAMNPINLVVDKKKSKEISREHSECKADFHAVCVSRFSKNKNQTALVDACVKYNEESIRPLCISFIGSGDSQWLRDYIQLVGGERYCKVIGYTSDVLEHINSSDFLVHASTIDSFSQAIMESLLIGRPVLAVRAGSVEDQIVDGLTGWIVNSADSGAIFNGLKRVTQSRGDLKRLSKKSRKITSERFTFSKMLEDYRMLVLSIDSK